MSESSNQSFVDAKLAARDQVADAIWEDVASATQPAAASRLTLELAILGDERGFDALAAANVARPFAHGSGATTGISSWEYIDVLTRYPTEPHLDRAWAVTLSQPVDYREPLRIAKAGKGSEIGEAALRMAVTIGNEQLTAIQNPGVTGAPYRYNGDVVATMLYAGVQRGDYSYFDRAFAAVKGSKLFGHDVNTFVLHAWLASHHAEDPEMKAELLQRSTALIARAKHVSAEKVFKWAAELDAPKAADLQGTLKQAKHVHYLPADALWQLELDEASGDLSPRKLAKARKATEKIVAEFDGKTGFRQSNFAEIADVLISYGSTKPDLVSDATYYLSEFEPHQGTPQKDIATAAERLVSYKDKPVASIDVVARAQELRDRISDAKERFEANTALICGTEDAQTLEEATAHLLDKRPWLNNKETSNVDIEKNYDVARFTGALALSK